ncbi:hypothetical protein ACFTAO_21860 [Paenibacillus rhizoplanae]
MFETVDGLPIEPGYFVTTDGERVRKATPADKYILGGSECYPLCPWRCKPLELERQIRKG